MSNKDKPLIDDQSIRDFGLKRAAYLRWTHDHTRFNWKEFARCQVIATGTYSETKHQFSIRNKDVLMNGQSSHKWWPALKSDVFSLDSSLPLLVGRGGELVCESVCKADLLASSPGSLLLCRSLAIQLLDLLAFAFRLSEVRRLLLDLDPYEGTDPLGMVSHFS